MKRLILLFALITLITAGYNRNAAVSYAKKNYNKANHDCNTRYDACSPYAYFGSEHCGYGSHGGNCANFVSQCLVKGGGHPGLTGSDVCRGYPCGFEEPGAWELGNCLKQKKWVSTCGYLMKPPSYIKAGDVLIYHSGSCDGNGHAVLITTAGRNVKITCQSSEQLDQNYNYMSNSKPYYQWLHYND